MPDSSSGNPCSNMHGGWQSGQMYGKCACRWPYFGEDCSLKMCPNSTYTDSGSGLTCDGHGSCDFKTGLCTCQTGYFGNDCHQRTCPFSDKNQQRMLLECNGEGVCDRTWGRCICIGDIEGTFLGQVTNNQPFGNHPFSESGGNSLSRYPSGVHPQWSRGEVGGASADSAGRTGGTSSDSNGFHQNFPGSSGGASSNKGYSTMGLHRPGEQHNTRLGHFNPTLPNGRITGFFGGQRFFATVAQLAPSYGWATKHLGEHSHIRLNHRYWGKACQRLHCPSYPDIQTYKPLRTLHTEHSHDDDSYRPYPNECSGPLQGDCDTTTGKCVCKAGWYGKDCAQRGKGDGTANRRLHFNYDPEKKLRPDGTLKDREGWTFSGEGTSTPQVNY